MKAVYLQLSGAGLLAFAAWFALEKENPDSRSISSQETLPVRKLRTLSNDNLPAPAKSVSVASAAMSPQSSPPARQQASVSVPDAPTSSNNRHGPAGATSRRGVRAGLTTATSPSRSIRDQDPAPIKAGAVIRKSFSGSNADSGPVRAPVALHDIADPAVSSPEAQESLAMIAEGFTAEVSTLDLDPASPAYRQLWDQAQIAADTRFRSMYGGQAWLRHHIQLHHALPQPTDPPP